MGEVIRRISTRCDILDKRKYRSRNDVHVSCITVGSSQPPGVVANDVLKQKKKRATTQIDIAPSGDMSFVRCLYTPSSIKF